jgi:hypothetical protein
MAYVRGSQKAIYDLWRINSVPRAAEGCPTPFIKAERNETPVRWLLEGFIDEKVHGQDGPLWALQPHSPGPIPRLSRVQQK